METSIGPGGQEALRHRGGSVFRALSSGTIRLGDAYDPREGQRSSGRSTWLMPWPICLLPLLMSKATIRGLAASGSASFSGHLLALDLDGDGAALGGGQLRAVGLGGLLLGDRRAGDDVVEQDGLDRVDVGDRGQRREGLLLGLRRLPGQGLHQRAERLHRWAGTPSPASCPGSGSSPGSSASPSARPTRRRRGCRSRPTSCRTCDRPRPAPWPGSCCRAWCCAGAASAGAARPDRARAPATAAVAVVVMMRFLMVFLSEGICGGDLRWNNQEADAGVPA